MLCFRPCPHGDVEEEQEHHKVCDMQGLLCQAAGTTELRSKTHVVIKSLQVQRVQECTASIQVRHSKAQAMGGELHAVLGAVWELRRGHQDECADDDLQSLLAKEAGGVFQPSQTKA